MSPRESLFKRILCDIQTYPIGAGILAYYLSRDILTSFGLLTSPTDNLDDGTYPVDVFGGSNISHVSVGNQPVLACQRGRPTLVSLLLIYVWRDNGHNHPKKVRVRIEPVNRCFPVNSNVASQFTRKELDKMEHECFQHGKYDSSLLFNTGKWLSFEPSELELVDRQIKAVKMRIDIPPDLSKEYDKGLHVMAIPKVIEPGPENSAEAYPIGTSSSGINIWIVD